MEPIKKSVKPKTQENKWNPVKPSETVSNPVNAIKSIHL